MNVDATSDVGWPKAIRYILNAFNDSPSIGLTDAEIVVGNGEGIRIFGHRLLVSPVQIGTIFWGL